MGWGDWHGGQPLALARFRFTASLSMYYEQRTSAYRRGENTAEYGYRMALVSEFQFHYFYIRYGKVLYMYTHQVIHK